LKRTTFLALFLGMTKRIVYSNRNFKLKNQDFTNTFLLLDQLIS
jgi:hypothetical protein